MKLNVPIQKILYSALFVENPRLLMHLFPKVHANLYYHHSTIEFKPNSFDDINVGHKSELVILGRLTTDKVDALLVDNKKSKNKHPHITLSTAEGISPFKTNEEFEKHPELIVMFDEPTVINVIEGYFDGVKACFNE